jgi:hypothetical protein
MIIKKIKNMTCNCTLGDRKVTGYHEGDFSVWFLHHIYLFGKYMGNQCSGFQVVPESPPVTQTVKIFPNSLR